MAESRRALILGANHQKLRRGLHLSIGQLNADIHAWIDMWNEDPRPFVWTKTAEQILDSDSIGSYRTRITELRH